MKLNVSDDATHRVNLARCVGKLKYIASDDDSFALSAKLAAKFDMVTIHFFPQYIFILLSNLFYFV